MHSTEQTKINMKFVESFVCKKVQSFFCDRWVVVFLCKCNDGWPKPQNCL